MDIICKVFNYKENLQEQRSLFRNSFPEVTNPTDEDYYWLLHGFPNTKHSSFEYVAYLDDEMVGYYAAIPYRYKINNKITNVGMVCGVMTSPNHRGKGIFTKLGAYSTAELASYVPFTTGYPIRKSVIPGHLKVGWKIAFKLPLYVKFIKINSVLKNNLKYLSFLSPIVNGFLILHNKIIKTKKQNKKYQISFYKSFKDIPTSKFELFTKKWANSISNALIKDSDFCAWRYGGPHKKYQFLVISYQDSICGFCAFTEVVREGVPSYCILDFSVLKENFDCVGFVYATLETEAKKNNIEAILLMMSKYSAHQYKLIKNGFIKSPFKFYLIIKNLTNEFTDEELFDEKKWHLMWVDSDDL